MKTITLNLGLIPLRHIEPTAEMFEVIACAQFTGSRFFAGVAAALRNEDATRELWPDAVSSPAVLQLEDLAQLPASLQLPLLTFLQDAASAWHASQPGVAFVIASVVVLLAEHYGPRVSASEAASDHLLDAVAVAWRPPQGEV